MKMKRFCVSLMVFALVCSVAFAAGQKDAGAKISEKIQLHVLYNDTDANVQKEMAWVMEQIPSLYPDIEIVLDMSPGDAQTYETKVRTLIAGGGENLDIWWERGGSWATPILNANSALALDDFLDESGYWDKVIPSSKLPASDGKIYSLPFEDIAYEVMLYNKAIFNEFNLTVPKTVSELKNIVRVLAQSDYVPISVGAKDGWCAAMMVEGFAYSIDPQITKKIVDGKAKFSDRPYAEAAQVIKDLLDLGAFSKNVALTGIDEALPLFESGKAAMMANGSWAVASGAAKMGDDFGYFYYPVIHDKDVALYGANCAGGVKQNSGYMVYAGTKYPEEAMKVAQSLAELRCKYVYTQQGNPFTVYIPENLGWKFDGEFAKPVQQLATDMQKFEFVFGLVQDVMPTAAASSGVMQSSSKFMTNSSKYTVADYLADLDKAALED